MTEKTQKKSVYLESSVISYLTAKENMEKKCLLAFFITQRYFKKSFYRTDINDND